MVSKTDFSQYTQKQLTILQIAEHYIESMIRANGSCKIAEVVSALRERLGWLIEDVAPYKLHNLISTANNMKAFENCSFELVRGVGFRTRTGGIMKRQFEGFADTLNEIDRAVYTRRIDTAVPDAVDRLAKDLQIAPRKIRGIETSIRGRMATYAAQAHH